MLPAAKKITIEKKANVGCDSVDKYVGGKAFIFSIRHTHTYSPN